MKVHSSFSPTNSDYNALFGNIDTTNKLHMGRNKCQSQCAGCQCRKSPVFSENVFEKSFYCDPLENDYKKVYGNIPVDSQSWSMARCNCTACNSCRCDCSCYTANSNAEAIWQ